VRRGVHVGLHDGPAVFAHVGGGAPDLLAVDDEVIPVIHTGGLQGDQVGSCVRFAVGEPEPDLTGTDGRQELLLELFISDQDKGGAHNTRGYTSRRDSVVAPNVTGNGRPLAEDSRVRKSLAAIAVELEVFLSLYWKLAWMQDRGEVPELEASALKLIFTELSVKMANAAVDLLGPYGLLDRGSERAPFGGRIGMGYLDSISGPIGAGTSEIQKTILATRGLGLPRGR